MSSIHCNDGSLSPPKPAVPRPLMGMVTVLPLVPVIDKDANFGPLDVGSKFTLKEDEFCWSIVVGSPENENWSASKPVI